MLALLYNRASQQSVVLSEHERGCDAMCHPLRLAVCLDGASLHYSAEAFKLTGYTSNQHTPVPKKQFYGSTPNGPTVRESVREGGGGTHVLHAYQ